MTSPVPDHLNAQVTLLIALKQKFEVKLPQLKELVACGKGVPDLISSTFEILYNVLSAQ